MHVLNNIHHVLLKNAPKKVLIVDWRWMPVRLLLIIRHFGSVLQSFIAVCWWTSYVSIPCSSMTSLELEPPPPPTPTPPHPTTTHHHHHPPPTPPIPWVQMGTFNKEIGFLCGLKFFNCIEYILWGKPTITDLNQIDWKQRRSRPSDRKSRAPGADRPQREFARAPLAASNSTDTTAFATGYIACTVHMSLNIALQTTWLCT